ncbi:myosin heavy chain kinase A, putative [Trypanosoma brucei gambiense DAL972]|uniref:Myosin heavy chain kinase A, putative n=2 Tax=Trypanosoma brucei TaxID=5691 RepID=C9ZWN7_TRYB9|nr:myosin heavy chain kinase A, putative [Trypanosoma brucei gambiense DAL972]RHW72772.1 myosin heavy chain kinase A [Trypanosoma brucei equiperdum]CBH13826.1 myosin heavy chain kinase A, putative [Trypanosoma brucei gambiense DAL972]|eukprot:XP_011776102.1 myosin heavy chain kinase A, putative [Trypanosoma brucei gambiense DAL972]
MQSAGGDSTPKPTGASCICSATKYIYSFRRKEWVVSDTNVQIIKPLKPFAKGGMRVCYEVEEIEDDGSRTRCIAKLFLKVVSDVKEEDYFCEGEAQCLCEEFANNFNKAPFRGPNKPRISFLQCQVLRISRNIIPREYRRLKDGFFSHRTVDTGDVLFVMEPKLGGHFTKYNSNYGDVYEDDKHCKTDSQKRKRQYMLHVAEAFSHFTLVDSVGSMLLCDLQGVNDLLTDPQIHTEDGRGLGLGNMGVEGITKFVVNHKCNEICEGLDLKPLTGVVPESSDEAKELNVYAYLRAQLRQDFIPPPKPISEMTEEEKFEHALQLSRVTY